MSAKHTPGPWIIDIEDDKRWDICVDRGDDLWVVVSMTPLLGGDVLTDKDKADARLIAAAPDLLIFAQNVSNGVIAPELMTHEGLIEVLLGWQKASRAAITKAIG